jgi:hypothetical protein
MTRLPLTLAALCCLGAAAFADIGKEELKKLARAGISDDVILSYVRSKGPVAKLSADDIIELKKAGLSDGLLSTLVSMAAPVPGKAAEGSIPSSTAEATAKLLSDPSVVYDGRYYYPRSYFTSEYGAYCSPALGIGVAYYYPAWVSARCAPVPWSVGHCSTRGYSYSYVRAGYGSCGSGGLRICNR